MKVFFPLSAFTIVNWGQCKADKIKWLYKVPLKNGEGNKQAQENHNCRRIATDVTQTCTMPEAKHQTTRRQWAKSQNKNGYIKYRPTKRRRQQASTRKSCEVMECMRTCILCHCFGAPWKHVGMVAVGEGIVHMLCPTQYMDTRKSTHWNLHIARSFRPFTVHPSSV